jgi:cytochrome b6-f complex iron-sulfur subunit
VDSTVTAAPALDTCHAGLCASRRSVLAAGAGVVGVAALAACGSKSKSAGAADSAAPASSASGALAKLSDVPVGGAVSATAGGKPILISQPTAGTVKAFSAICTHMGCTVGPGKGELDCPCHGSRYNLSTGAVIGGPAPKPLTEIPVKVVNGEVVPA